MTTAKRRNPPTQPTFGSAPIARIVGALVPCAFLASQAAAHQPATSPATPPTIPQVSTEAFTQTIPGTTVSLEMVPIPAGTLTRADPADPSTPTIIEIHAFSMSSTEITWDLYDIFVFALDQPDPTRPADADVVARPSKPYLPPDRGFGHSGYPALSMTHHAAEAFCLWLSAKTGRTYRLPTEDEWEYACRAGSTDDWCFGSDPSQLPDFAWNADTAGFTTHPVATLAPNALGLFDMHGNAAEWAQGNDAKPIVCGGSYLSVPAETTATSRLRQTRDWQASDPQIPRSRWWLADAPHVGFRVVCEDEQP